MTVQTQSHNQQHSIDEIQNWLISYLAQILEVAPDEIDVKIPFDEYGMDSALTVGMAGDLANWLGCRFEPTLIYDYPTIDSLARHVASVLTSG
ncbi:MAG: acyl carrier protein [Desmonostoc vinosum HA7617-LM4]|nr:acyl carrier protein [Desmonostoc vinosum HA7617-LM4]